MGPVDTSEFGSGILWGEGAEFIVQINIIVQYNIIVQPSDVCLQRRVSKINQCYRSIVNMSILLITYCVFDPGAGTATAEGGGHFCTRLFCGLPTFR